MITCALIRAEYLTRPQPTTSYTSPFEEPNTQALPANYPTCILSLFRQHQEKKSIVSGLGNLRKGLGIQLLEEHQRDYSTLILSIMGTGEAASVSRDEQKPDNYTIRSECQQCSKPVFTWTAAIRQWTLELQAGGDFPRPVQ